jgi:cell division transport system ATP-binding protein
MIQLFHVWKTYSPDHHVLEDVSLSIAKGEFVFITGPSGSGKTTFVKLLFCEERASRGEIIVNGRNLRKIPNRAVAFLRREVGVVFQDFRLLPKRTVLDNVALAAEAVGHPRKKSCRLAIERLEELGLAEKVHSRSVALSGGEQQRVAIARALVNTPSLVLADEPTGNLDPQLTGEIMDVLFRIHQAGTTVLVATHDSNIIDRFGSRVLRLQQGQVGV